MWYHIILYCSSHLSESGLLFRNVGRVDISNANEHSPFLMKHESLKWIPLLQHLWILFLSSVFKMLPVPALLPYCSPCVHQVLEVSCCGKKDVSGRALKGPQMVIKQLVLFFVFFFLKGKRHLPPFSSLTDRIHYKRHWMCLEQNPSISKCHYMTTIHYFGVRSPSPYWNQSNWEKRHKFRFSCHQDQK